MPEWEKELGGRVKVVKPVDLMKSIRDRGEKEDEELLTKSKPYKELIVPIHAVVESVDGFNYSTSHTPISEMIIGERSPEYHTGYQTQLEIKVSIHPSWPKEHPVRHLTFNGNSALRTDEMLIVAYIFAGERKELNQYTGIILGGEDMKNSVFIPRDLTEEEDALYIEIIGKKGRPVRTDYSVNFRRDLIEGKK